MCCRRFRGPWEENFQWLPFRWWAAWMKRTEPIAASRYTKERKKGWERQTKRERQRERERERERIQSQNIQNTATHSFHHTPNPNPIISICIEKGSKDAKKPISTKRPDSSHRCVGHREVDTNTQDTTINSPYILKNRNNTSYICIFVEVQRTPRLYGRRFQGTIHIKIMAMISFQGKTLLFCILLLLFHRKSIDI